MLDFGHVAASGGGADETGVRTSAANAGFLELRRGGKIRLGLLQLCNLMQFVSKWYRVISLGCKRFLQQ